MNRAEIAEILGRDIDPINDVRIQLQSRRAGNYYDPLDGDWISDDYYRAIDLTTHPGRLSAEDFGKLDRSITRLSEKSPHIQEMLEDPALIVAYNSVALQINEINSSDPEREKISVFETLSLAQPDR